MTVAMFVIALIAIIGVLATTLAVAVDNDDIAVIFATMSAIVTLILAVLAIVNFAIN